MCATWLKCWKGGLLLPRHRPRPRLHDQDDDDEKEDEDQDEDEDEDEVKDKDEDQDQDPDRNDDDGAAPSDDHNSRSQWWNRYKDLICWTISEYEGQVALN